MMIAVEITSRHSGSLLFRYEFIPTMMDNLKELRAGALSAIINVMDETFGSQQRKVMKYGRFEIIIQEWYHSYALLYTFEADEYQEQFLTDLVEKFENQFITEIEDLEKNNVFDENSFDFSQETLQAYNQLLQVDVERLSKIIEIMNVSSTHPVFTDSLMFSRPGLNRIFTNITDKRYYGYSEEIVRIFKDFLTLEHKTPFSLEHFHVKLTRKVDAFLFNLAPYAIIVFLNEDKVEQAKEYIKDIKERFNDYLLSKLNEQMKEE